LIIDVANDVKEIAEMRHVLELEGADVSFLVEDLNIVLVVSTSASHENFVFVFPIVISGIEYVDRGLSYNKPERAILSTD